MAELAVNYTWKTNDSNREYIERNMLNHSMRTALSVYYSFVIVGSLVCNITLIAIISKERKLHTVRHLFIVNLAISNLLTSIIYLPLDVDEMTRGYFVHGKVLCAVYKLSFMLSLPLSMINLLLLTLETFVTIAFPYKKSNFVKKRNVITCLVIAYTYAVIFTLFPVLQKPRSSILILNGTDCIVDTSITYIYIFIIMNMCIPLCVIVLLNIWIFRIANSQTKKIRSYYIKDIHLVSPNVKDLATPLTTTRASSNDNVINVSNKPVGCMSLRKTNNDFFMCKESKKVNERKTNFSGSKRSKTILILNIKAAKRIALLVAECLFCWLFYNIVVLRNVSGYYSPIMTKVGNVINYSSLFLNPLVYGLLNPKIRKVILKSCCVCTDETYDKRSTLRSYSLKTRAESFASE